MKLINQSVEYIPQEEGLEGMYKQIENAARTCYKSENNSTGDSKSFVDKLIKMKHFSMLEHGTIYLKASVDHSNEDYIDFDMKYTQNPYSRLIYESGIAYVTTNYRVLIENNWVDDIQKYSAEHNVYHQKRYTFRIVTSIGIVRELLRHRVFSFANESTRYCNYSKDKFNNEITFVEPYWLHKATKLQQTEFEFYCKTAEDTYLALLGKWDERKPDGRFKTGFKDNPLTPQAAREVLPLCTKSELVMTGFKDDWDRFLELRLDGVTGKPHPDMLQLASMIKSSLH